MQTGFPIALVAVRERQGLFATFAYNSNSTHGYNYNYCRVVDTCRCSSSYMYISMYMVIHSSYIVRLS